jgi:hypothetical protein
MSSRRNARKINLEALTGPAANLRAVAGDAMMHDALALVQARLRLTPEKLAVLLLRQLNPEEILYVPEECRLRGVSDKTLKGMKDGKELPAVP